MELAPPRPAMPGRAVRPKKAARTARKAKAAAGGSLAEYRRKRRFDVTPEPAGEVAASPGPELVFVVQKHAARRLHYDFRLELGGVLKSWAVPKGPSLDPADRRLAVATEDHPLDYGDFEGVIPEGQYGGGTVLLWDRGRWLPDGGSEEAAEEAYRKGKLEFRLEGGKLRGGWRLIQTHGPRSEGGKNWLLIKRNDDAALPGRGEALVEERTESVASGREMDAIAADPERVWHSGGDGGAEEVAPDLRRRRRAAGGEEVDPGSLPGARQAKLPRHPPAPQLATLTDRPPAGDDWLHEIKHDGYRVIARLERRRGGGMEVRLVTRNGNDWTDRFPAIAEALAGLPVAAALVDGEVVALSPDGTSSFAALQQALGTKGRRGGRGGGRAALVLYAFDLLHLDGWDLARSPLEERKALLAGLLARAGADETTTLRASDHVAGRGEAFFRQACRFALEGVVSKRRDAPYRPGRGRDWLKVKCSERQEFVIGGFTEPTGSRSGIGSLILGVYPGGGSKGRRRGEKLLYAGRVGTGFDARTLTALRRRLEAIESDAPPFADPKAAATGGSRRAVHWVRPELVCEVAFTEWTEDGVLRHPSFQGLREDKAPAEVVREEPAAGGAAAVAGGAAEGDGEPAKSAEEPRRKTTAATKATRRAGEAAKAARADREEAAMARKGAGRGRGAGTGGGGKAGAGKNHPVEIGGTRVTNPDRVLYAEQGVTKRRLAEYYVAVAPAMLPHLAGRPLTLVRCPQGQGEPCFYQKHIEKGFPASVERVEVAEKDGQLATYAVVESLPALVALVQMGVLEIHVWGARRDRIERPDLLVWDLDPDEGLPWARVVEAATAVRTVLDELGLASFAKTTGGKGLHVVVPIERRLGWDDARDFARAVAEHIVAAAPDRFLATMSKAKRKGKVFIDYLRNARGATFIAPFSARAKPGATVAVPVSWEAVPRIDPARFDVTTVPGWLAKRTADPWAGIAEVRQAVTKEMRRRVGAG